MQAGPEESPRINASPKMNDAVTAGILPPLSFPIYMAGPYSAIQTVGGGREAGGRQERRDEGNWALEWGRVETGGGCVAG
jgi:hypothetical protein